MYKMMCKNTSWYYLIFFFFVTTFLLAANFIRRHDYSSHSVHAANLTCKSHQSNRVSNFKFNFTQSIYLSIKRGRFRTEEFKKNTHHHAKYNHNNNISDYSWPSSCTSEYNIVIHHDFTMTVLYIIKTATAALQYERKIAQNDSSSAYRLKK